MSISVPKWKLEWGIQFKFMGTIKSACVKKRLSLCVCDLYCITCVYVHKYNFPNAAITKFVIIFHTSKAPIHSARDTIRQQPAFHLPKIKSPWIFRKKRFLSRQEINRRSCKQFHIETLLFRFRHFGCRQK